MYIKQIQLRNFQAIKEFQGNFEGNVYLVTGENELGKSTLLKAIMILLTGNRDEVLRNGEDKGFAKIVVGGDGKEYEVELRMTKANPRGTLTIKTSTGLKSDRISALQEIFGYQDFDANEFASWSETAEGRRKQVQMVKSILPDSLQKRIEKIDSDVLSLKESRRLDNVSLRTYEALLDEAKSSINDGDEEEYAEAIDIQDLLKQQETFVNLKAKEKSVREMLALREATINEMPAKKKELQEKKEASKEGYRLRLEELKERYEEAVKKENDSYIEAMAEYDRTEKALDEKLQDAIMRRDNCKNWLNNYEQNKPEDLTDKIRTAQQHNDKNQKVLHYQDARNNRDNISRRVADYDKKISTLMEERANLIKNANIPISGLNFTDEGLQLNDIPFVAGKVSDSQIMEVAAKLIIAKNPNVKVFRIARGESLGKKKLEALVKFAKDNGYQGFIENVVREQNELRVEQYKE